jgi:Tfp pilus assembly protein PilF/cellulose biosynthesis protein BcsQ
MTHEQRQATFVTFYSFKGGVGRTMALINTAGILAGRGFRVLVIDLDLEAPGLSYLDPNAPDASPSEQTLTRRPLQWGFVDLLYDAKQRGQDADLFALSVEDLAARYTQAYHVPDDLLEFEDGSLHIMPAGRFDGSYAQRLDDLNLHELYEQGLGEPLIRAFKNKFAEAGLYDYVLVDSRSGFSDEAGICTRDLADHLMILSGLNRQNVEGTCEFLKTLRAATDGRKSFQIILSPVPNGEDALVDQRETAAKAAFKAAWGSTVHLSLQIPYHPQLALTEDPHIFRRRRGYLFEAYREIERRMLRALGHDVQTLLRTIDEMLVDREYGRALHDLRHLIRLDEGRGALWQIVGRLTLFKGILLRSGRTEHADSRAELTLDTILGHEDGYRFLECVVDNLPLKNPRLSPQMLIQQLKGSSIDLTDKLYQRMARLEPRDANALNDYAVFLWQECTDVDRAEVYFNQAIEAEPTTAHYLVSYAHFLWNQRSDIDGAEEHFKRAIEAEPDWSPGHGNYATFLWQELGDQDNAEVYFKQAIEADPTSARHLANYANFLWQERGDRDNAEVYFKRMFETDPTVPAVLGNYGQFLVALGRLDEARLLLLSAFQQSHPRETADLAEFCFSLWLVSRMQGQNEHDAERWERGFKYLIQQGFKRPRWNFDRMLEQAEKHLPPDEFDYAKALSRAFLDEGKVAELEQCERWRALVPRDPKQQEQPVTVRSPVRTSR